MLFAIILSSAFFYVNNIILGRVLGTTTYGEFGALFSLSFFLQFILFRSVTVMDAQFISKFKGQGNYHMISDFHSKMLFYMTGVGIVAFVIFSLLSSQIAYFLNIDSQLLIILIGVLFLFCWPLSVNIGTIQGLQRFNQVALLNVLPAVLRCIISVGLVFLGFNIFGAVWGLVIGTIIALIISFFLLRDTIPVPHLKIPSQSVPDLNRIQDLSYEIHLEIKEAFRFSIPVLCAVICIAIPTNIDVVLVKHFFTAGETGLYTAVSVFGRMAFSVPIAIITVMYPIIVEAHTIKRETRSILKRSLIYTGIPTGLFALAFYIFPELFLGIFYGQEYLEAISLLQLYGIFIFFFSLITVLIYNSLAKNRYGFVYVFTAFSFLEIGLICLYHSSTLIVLEIFLVISFFLFLIGLYINYLKVDIKKTF